MIFYVLTLRLSCNETDSKKIPFSVKESSEKMFKCFTSDSILSLPELHELLDCFDKIPSTDLNQVETMLNYTRKVLKLSESNIDKNELHLALDKRRNESMKHLMDSLLNIGIVFSSGIEYSFSAYFDWAEKRYRASVTKVDWISLRNVLEECLVFWQKCPDVLSCSRANLKTIQDYLNMYFACNKPWIQANGEIPVIGGNISSFQAKSPKIWLNFI